MLIDQAGPVGTFMWTKGRIALFKSLERLNQLVMYQGPVVSRIKINENGNPCITQTDVWDSVTADDWDSKYIKYIIKPILIFLWDTDWGKTTVKLILYFYHRPGHHNRVVFKSILRGMFNCTVFHLNSWGMEPHLGLEFNGAFGAESALKKAVS